MDSFDPKPFGRYLLLRRLAAGGMGEVYLAKLTGPGGFEKLLVIKRILELHADNPDYVDMFFAEARLVAKLAHRNLVPIYEMGRVDEQYYVAMEYISGRSMTEVMIALDNRGERLGLPLFGEIAVQLCEGLAYAHAAADSSGPLNLIHRDISPRNVLISYAGDVKIIDFGIAKSRMSQHETEAGRIKGKLAYMSPEQCSARPLDRRTDIFSLGVCLYELATLQHPFAHEDRFLTFDAIQREPAAPLSSLDPRLAPFDPVIARALEKDPEQRYHDCGEMLEAVRGALSRLPHEPPGINLGTFMREMFTQELAEEEETIRIAVDPSLLASAPPVPEEPTTVWKQLGIRPLLGTVFAVLLAGAFVASVALYALGEAHGRAEAAAKPAAVALTEVAPDPDWLPPPALPAPVPTPSVPPVEDDSVAQSATSSGEQPPAVGVLRIRTTPRLSGLRARQLERGIWMQSPNGSVTFGRGRDPQRDPFRITVGYSLGKKGIVYRIESRPWALVQQPSGASPGKTPQSVHARDRTTRLRLVNPDGRTLDLTLALERRGQH